VSTRAHRRAIALLAAGLLALTACGGTSASENGQKKLPGIKEFGLTEKQYNEHIEKTEQAISKCMADAGFEYVPVDVKTVAAAQLRVRTDPNLTRREFKEHWGLAVTTRFDDPVRDIGMGPNLKIWHSLPPAEQEAYSRTLWGKDPRADFVFTFDEEDFSTTGGCTRKAVAQVFTKAQLRGSYVNPKDVLVESDPRIVKANQNWVECMHRHGYNYQDDQDEIIDEYGERLDNLLQGDNPRTLTGARLDALHKLQKSEIKVSLVDLECQLKYTDDVYREVEIEIFGFPVSG
jgi:hypothetical protein